MKAPPLEARATGGLVLAALYLQPTPEREQALRRASAAELDWDLAARALEGHGFLGLARVNLERAGARVPAWALEQLRARAEVMGAIAAGFRLTLERFLAEAQRTGIEVTLLKGAALALDLYPAEGLRSQGDLDLLVREQDVPAALGAAQRIGLGQPEQALPVWWYRLAHFHLKLVPRDALQRELELHWHLHPPAQLLSVRLEALFARRRALEVAGMPAWTLDHGDRLLHLVTHLARHCPDAERSRASLLAIACQPAHPLRLKWLLDLRSEIEQRHAELGAATLAARAAEWSAEHDLARTLRWIRDVLGLTPPALTWVERLLERMPDPAAGATGSSDVARLERPIPGLDLRASALAAFPRWVWPPRSYLERIRGSSSARARLGHAARILARASATGLATPFAWLVRTRRNDGTPTHLGPAEALELAAAARRLRR